MSKKVACIKKLNRNIIDIVTFVFLIVLVTFCNESVFAMSKNEKNEKVMKNEIRELVDEVIFGFINNHPDRILQVCSDTLKGIIGEQVEKMISLYSSRFHSDNYNVLNGIHLKNISVGRQMIVRTGKTGLHDYSFPLTSLNNEVFIETGYLNSENEQNLLMTVWGKYGEEWLLNYMHVGIYSIGNRNAVDWYLLSKKDYEKGDYFDASLKLMFVSKLLSKNALPFVYEKDKEIREYGRQVSTHLMKELKLPLKVSEIKTMPTIFKIRPKIDHDTIYPHISYVSSINIGDTLGLEQECNDLHSIIDSIYKGINQNNSKIFYQIFEEVPVGNTLPVYRELFRVVKK